MGAEIVQPTKIDAWVDPFIYCIKLKVNKFFYQLTDGEINLCHGYKLVLE